MLDALQTKNYSAVLALVPRSINEVTECPPVKELLNQGAAINDLEACLAVEIAKVANMLTVGGNLRQGQSVEIAKQLIGDFPNESLQDFCLCLRLGIKGTYGEIFRFDVMVINEWFGKYLQSKYDAIEQKLMQEKDDLYKPIMISGKVDDPERHQRWLDKLKAAVESGTRKVPDLTPREIQDEGQKKPKPKTAYDNGYTLEFIEQKRKIQRAASEFYRLRTSLKLQTFVVNGSEVMAESQSDADQIVKNANQND